MRYPYYWVETCINSIKNQTFQDFDVFEIDYGGTNRQMYEGSNFLNCRLRNHAEALNCLLDKVFSLGYDCAFNTNIDDFYSAERFEKQLPYIEQGYDIVSSNMHMVDKEGKVLKSFEFSSMNIFREAFEENNNCIAHPVVCYSKNFKERLIPSEIPRDDFECWKRAYTSGKYKFIVIPEYLLYYRISDLKVS